MEMRESHRASVRDRSKVGWASPTECPMVGGAHPTFCVDVATSSHAETACPIAGIRNTPAGQYSMIAPLTASVTAPAPAQTKLYAEMRLDNCPASSPTETKLSSIGQLSATMAV